MTGQNPSFNLSGIFPSDICLTPGQGYNVECLHKWFCPQIPHYFINAGIALIIAYVAASWASWWVLNKSGGLRLGEDINGSWGLFYWSIPLDFGNPKTRLYWYDFIVRAVSLALLTYVIILVYFFSA